MIVKIKDTTQDAGVVMDLFLEQREDGVALRGKDSHGGTWTIAKIDNAGVFHFARFISDSSDWNLEPGERTIKIGKPI